MKTEKKGVGVINLNLLLQNFSKITNAINNIMSYYRSEYQKVSKEVNGINLLNSPKKGVNSINPLRWNSEVIPLQIKNYMDVLSNENKRIIVYFLMKNGFGWFNIFKNDFSMNPNSLMLALRSLEKGRIIKKTENKEVEKYMWSPKHYELSFIYELDDLARIFFEGIDEENWNLDKDIIEKANNWKSRHIEKKEEKKKKRIKKKYGEKIKEYGIEDIDEIDKLERILPDTKAREAYLEIKKDRIRKGKKVISSAQIHFILQRSGIIKTKSSIKNYIIIIERSGLIEKISKPDEIGRFIVKSPDEIFESENESGNDKNESKGDNPVDIDPSDPICGECNYFRIPNDDENHGWCKLKRKQARKDDPVCGAFKRKE